ASLGSRRWSRPRAWRSGARPEWSARRTRPPRPRTRRVPTDGSGTASPFPRGDRGTYVGERLLTIDQLDAAVANLVDAPFDLCRPHCLPALAAHFLPIV